MNSLAYAGGMDYEEIEECKRAFNVFDTDKGGTISVEELGNVMKVIGQNVNADELADMINEIDEDCNGEIDFQEFLSLMQQKKREQKFEEEIIEAFNIFDIKGNNGFTFDNLKELLKELKIELPEEQIKEMVEEADIDGDGMVNFEEFKRIMFATQPKLQ